MKNAQKKFGRTTFSMFLLLCTVLLIISSLSLSPTSRMFPLIVAIPAAVLLLIQVCQDIWPRTGEIIPFFREQAIVEIELPDNLVGAVEAESDGDEDSKSMGELLVFGWLAGLTLLIYFLHYLIVAPIFIFTFLRFQAKASWKTSIGVTVVMWLCLYLLFYRLLRLGYF